MGSGAHAPGLAQGVPTFDAQNLTNQIQQLQHMLDDLGIQTDQLDTLLEQVALLGDQLSELQEIHGILTSQNPMSILMGGDLDCLLPAGFRKALTGVVSSLSQGDLMGALSGGCGNMAQSVEQVLTSTGLSFGDGSANVAIRAARCTKTGPAGLRGGGFPVRQHKARMNARTRASGASKSW